MANPTISMNGNTVDYWYQQFRGEDIIIDVRRTVCKLIYDLVDVAILEPVGVTLAELWAGNLERFVEKWFDSSPEIKDRWFNIQYTNTGTRLVVSAGSQGCNTKVLLVDTNTAEKVFV